MKERLITLLGALLAVYLVIMLLMPPQRSQENVSVPTSADAGTDGLLGLKRWLDKAGVPTLSLRERYTRLGKIGAAANGGNLLIVTLPQAAPARFQEVLQLRRWLDQGNDLLLLAAANDFPAWLRQVPDRDIHTFTESLGFRLNVKSTEPKEPEDKKRKRRDFKQALKDIREDFKPAERIAVPAETHPAIQGVREVGLKAHRVGNPHRLEPLGTRLTDPLLKDRDSGEPVLWHLRVGTGNAWVFSHAEVFGNTSLGQRDNARLLENILGLSLRDKGAVIFDDMHQGLSSLYDESAFFRDPRLHKTLWFALGLWLLWVMGHGNRIGPVVERARPAAAVDLVRAVGGFFARRLDERGAARRLLDQFLTEVCALRGWPRDPGTAWARLAELPGLDERALTELRTQQERLKQDKPPDLRGLCHSVAILRKGLS
jgi:hypothetical protein